MFECDLDQATFEQVGRKLAALIDLSTDSVRCYRLDAAAVQRTQIVGIGQITVVPSHYLIGGQRRAPLGDS